MDGGTDGWSDFVASSSFSQFGAGLESQFDLNIGSVLSSQALSSIEFCRIPEDDNFDINCIHPAIRAGFTPMSDQS
ncbi:hypothetical protein R1flu_025446 [Riccia fluitans]|uniref:Uncharacterized protein n=1 Tax=Riccia fluitans TaxID=41844 RepID=A0ABD1XY76_9MARC